MLTYCILYRGSIASKKEVTVFPLSRKAVGLILLCEIQFNKRPACKAFCEILRVKKEGLEIINKTALTLG